MAREGMQSETPSSFGAVLRRHRTLAGLTQEALAERAGLSRRGIADLERGARKFPYGDTIRRLADALELLPEDRMVLLTAGRQSDPPRERKSGSVGTPMGATSRWQLIGRDREFSAISGLLLDEAAAVVTVVGPGGVGKTKLAARIADMLVDAYAQGVHWVDLAPLSRPELVVQTTAEALGLRIELDRDPVPAVLAYLGDRRALLVLDNCEHLIGACADLATMVVAHCPHMQMLMTSREPLGIQGEAVWRLGPLGSEDARRLFVERARAQRVDFEPEDNEAIQQVCHALDNLPLAIELAAARVTMLSPAEILLRLEDRFALLKRPGARGASPRQQTLLATLDWSYQLLDPLEQQLLRRLSAFSGSFDLSAASVMLEGDAFDVLAQLVNKSLVVADVGEQYTNYRLLDTLRSYSWDRLTEAGEVELARQRHLDYFLNRAESLFRVIESMDGPTRALDSSINDLRSALQWCSSADPEAGLRLIAATRPVWLRHDCGEGRAWANQFLERCPQPSRARAQALLVVGEQESVADTARARRALLEALDLAVLFEDSKSLLYAHAMLAAVAMVDQQPETALPHARTALAIAEGLADSDALGIALWVLSLVLLTDRDSDQEALMHIERAQVLSLGPHPNRGVAALANWNYGLYLRRRRRPGEALLQFRLAARDFHLLGETTQLSLLLFEIGRLLADADPERAARLGSAGVTLGTRVGAVWWGSRHKDSVDRFREKLSKLLGPAESEAAWTAGERLSRDEAIALALQEDDVMDRPVRKALTRREQEVLSLLARGYSNRQIASALVVSERTADGHVANILSKLGVMNRAQAALWAVDHRASLLPRA